MTKEVHPWEMLLLGAFAGAVGAFALIGMIAFIDLAVDDYEQGQCAVKCAPFMEQLWEDACFCLIPVALKEER